jgi:F-type H+-transporting ATPase subunit delta
VHEQRIADYAEGLFSIVKAEGHVGQIGDELFRFARALEGSEELRNALVDPHIPAGTRQEIVDRLLEGKASNLTIGIVGLVVAAGRAAQLPPIIDELVRLAASAHGREVAEVRSAIELTDEQKQRLATAIKESTGRDVEVKVVVDPTVLGGVVTQIGDTVIDGSVRHRLAQLKSFA